MFRFALYNYSKMRSEATHNIFRQENISFIISKIYHIRCKRIYHFVEDNSPTNRNLFYIPQLSVKKKKILHQKFPKHANLINYRKFTQNERRDSIFITVFITDPPFFHHGFITEKTLQSPIRKAFQEVGFSFFIADSSPMPHFFITVFITVHTIIYRKNVIRRMYKKKERRKREEREKKNKEKRKHARKRRQQKTLKNFFIFSDFRGKWGEIRFGDLLQ